MILLPDVSLWVGSSEIVECITLKPLQVVGLRLYSGLRRLRRRRRRHGLRVVEPSGGRGGRHVGRRRRGRPRSRPRRGRREVVWELRPRDERRELQLVGRQVVGVSRLLSPGALDGVAVDVGVVHRHDGVGGRLLCGKP